MKKEDFDIRVFAERFSNLLENSEENTHSLAKKLALNPATISRYANGLMAPKLITLYAIADIFKVDPLWLMGLEDQKEKTAETDSLSPIKQKILNNCSNLSEKELDDVLDYIEYKISQRK